MIPKLFLSHRMDALIDPLIEEIEGIDSLETRTVLVPNGQVKQWLLLEIARRKGIAMGLKVLEIGQLFPFSLHSLELFCLIYSALLESKRPELISYLEGKRKRLLDLTGELSRLFTQYGQYDASLFSGKGLNWQEEILQKIFVDGPWRLPVQQEFSLMDPVICFWIDELPPVYWQFLMKAPSLSIYLFSPCIEFWADLCSDRERKRLIGYWKKQGSAKKSRDQLDAYLREAPRTLANWGKLGRETLKIFDSFDLETQEFYPPLQPTTLLKQIQNDLLMFQETKQPKTDPSIKILRTGSSRLREIEALKEEILSLKVSYHEISVLAPDIEPYVPLIAFVFANDIPYRISGVDVAPQSSFRQGLIRLLRLSGGRWDAEEVLALFETPSFYKKQLWDPEMLEEYRFWIESAGIRWGLDAVHRQTVLQETLDSRVYEDQGSWEKGLDALLDALVYLKPLQINPDRFEQLISVLFALQKMDLKGEKTLLSWADSLEKAVEAFLAFDPEDEADAAAQNAFRDLLLDMRKITSQELFPFDVIQPFLIRPCKGQIHSSHLHAVHFASIEEGASLPAKALFLIGMDEESFPKVQLPSSLNLLRQKIVGQAERDRYLFLQAIFSAQEFLRISYSHLSADEGKPVGPSLLVQELLALTGSKISTVYQAAPRQEIKKSLSWPKWGKIDFPEGEVTLSFSELRQLARHPWKFFLQKKHKIHLDEELEESFALKRGKLVREWMENPEELQTKFPLGIFGKAMELEIFEKGSEWKSQLEAWQIKPFSLYFKERCSKAEWEGSNYTSPPIEFSWDKLKVKLVGEIKQASEKGMISFHEDHIGGTVKIWPEALAVAHCFSASEIWMIRNGKNRSFENPYEHLKAFIEYYFHCLCAPSPLLPEWADLFLRKGVKKLEQGPFFEDLAMQWVLARAEIPSPEEMVENWGPFLKKTFQGLIELYPLRAGYAKI